MIASTYNILHTCIVLIYYNYLLITDRIVKILVLSIVSLQLAVGLLCMFPKYLIVLCCFLMKSKLFLLILLFYNFILQCNNILYRMHLHILNCHIIMIVIIDIYINSTYFNKMNNYLSPQIIEYIRDHDLYR
jgi:hypothetical protein